MSIETRRVAILGSTGSVGRQALEVIAGNPSRFQAVALCAGSDRDSLDEQAEGFKVRNTGLGEQAAVELATLPEADVVLNAIVGAVGLRATLAALEAGKTVALANKESLVAGGRLCLAAAERGGGSLVPVDSEHAALAQCLRGRGREDVARLVITASGGPFRTRSDMTGVTPEEALAHPTWSMGPKITVDSATLMNKAFEVIEAHYFFDFDYDAIGVVVHPQSVIHAAVQLLDGSLVMHAAVTDMKIPIAAALAWPDPIASLEEGLDLASTGSLGFEEVDHTRFPSVGLGYQAGRAGRTYPAALNAANEVAVGSFLAGRLDFPGITAVAQEVLDRHDPLDENVLTDVLEADAGARRAATDLIARRSELTVGGAR